MNIDNTIRIEDVEPRIADVTALAKKKITAMHARWKDEWGTPVCTRAGLYTSRSWTEWTRGFYVGLPLLVFDIDGDEAFLNLGRNACVHSMATHITHMGVHDHGFNSVSTYGNLLRLMNEGRIAENAWERHFYELALKVSGAVQARRWTHLSDESGFVHSFNGAHSLFADTIRSMRVLALSHLLGHSLKDEQDASVSLLKRMILHAEATSAYNVYFGKARDTYDVRGRVAHESVFNVRSRSYRCPNSQQGFSPFTTWTRAHAWILCGYAEQLEYLHSVSPHEFASCSCAKDDVLALFLETARAVADFYIAQMPKDGVPYWDTGAPSLHKIERYAERDADPYNQHEPVDSSAAAIAAQGLIRLGMYLHKDGLHYYQAGLTIAKRLTGEPYISQDGAHEGLLLHSIYHYPNGWDYIPKGSAIPCGESCMWGDYHFMELMAYLKRVAQGAYYTFGWKEMQR